MQLLVHRLQRFEDVPGCYGVGSGVLRSGVVLRRVLVWVPVGGPIRGGFRVKPPKNLLIW